MKWSYVTVYTFSHHRKYFLSISRGNVGKLATERTPDKPDFLYASQMYLVIFPEGTRYNPELTKVISASQTFAAKEGE